MDRQEFLMQLNKNDKFFMSCRFSISAIPASPSLKPELYRGGTYMLNIHQPLNSSMKKGQEFQY